MFVLDTDVISRTSPLSKPDLNLQAWFSLYEAVSYLSVATLSELHLGTELARRRGASRKADNLQAWLDGVMVVFVDRLLPIDPPIARRTGELLAKAEAAGQNPGFVDACIAATAEILEHRVVTFNARHFAVFDVPFGPPGN